MAGFARKAIVLTISRLANYALMIVSPVVLVRMLTKEDFGHYRNFLLYASILQAVATFAINDSLLYFIPTHPKSPWRLVRETNVLTLGLSVAVLLVVLAANALSSGHLIGEYPLPVCIYVLLYANIDFWECYWLAEHRPNPVFAYTMARLMTRMLVVTSVAILTHDVWKIVLALIALEAVRMGMSIAAWGSFSQAAREPKVENIRREQLRFCVPAGLATICYMISRNLGNIAVTRYLGDAALGVLTVGTFGEPIIMALRNSISTIVLPELVRRSAQDAPGSLLLWQRAVVVNCILLLPSAALVALFAEPLVLTAFKEAYAAAIPVMQIYALVIVRSCFDFAPPLRAVNKTGPLMTSNFIAGIGSGVTLLLLLPVDGIVGAGWALVVSNMLEAIYLAWSVKRHYKLTYASMLPWNVVLHVALCAGLSALPILAIEQYTQVNIIGAMLLGGVYVAVFALLLLALRVEEAIKLGRRIKFSVLSFARS
ncbi:MAG TPA: oligosaccharide flippase family protein [Steroidobacteraceae bacterium]|jgi:O-antigen/teichoic acid export membrane protein|nr:oligosaccharide flippase family protein [Steroidobacteraceae bacterium]